MTIRVVLVDDHPIVLGGLKQLFAMEDDIEIVGDCIDGETALEVVEETKPDVLVLDIRIPRKDGMAVLRELSKKDDSPAVVLLTAAVSDEEVVEAVRYGVRGVVLKEMAPHLLVQCVRKVYAGGQWIEKESFGRAMDKLLRREEAVQKASLTPREMEILQMVSLGLRNREMAERLCISEGTVKIHLHRIYEKLKIGGRMELMVYARDHGLI